jgi:N-acetylmuramoyl-L-alanine amidase
LNAPAVFSNPLPYISSLSPRLCSSIDLVVLHCTELPDLATARTYGQRIYYPESGTGNSGHFYIGRDGRIEQWVPTDRVAHHVRNFNERSIGIELVNIGRYPNWFDSRNQKMSEPYIPQQLSSLITLLSGLKNDLSNLQWITGHEDLDASFVAATDKPGQMVRRKRDPGPCFPWPEILEQVPLKRFDENSENRAE